MPRDQGFSGHQYEFDEMSRFRLGAQADEAVSDRSLLFRVEHLKRTPSTPALISRDRIPSFISEGINTIAAKRKGNRAIREAWHVSDFDWAIAI